MQISTQASEIWRSEVKETSLINHSQKNNVKIENDNKSTIDTFKPFGADGLSFFDLIDMVNPLHHIPFVNSMYRNITGDEIDPVPKIAGGSLFFGPIGLLGATLNVIVKNVTGEDINSHVSSVFTNTKSENTSYDKEETKNANLNFSNDPVTKWARAETYYRQELASKFDASINNKKYYDGSVYLSNDKTADALRSKYDLLI